MAAIWDWVRLCVVGTIMDDVSFAERCPRSLLQFVNTFTVYGKSWPASRGISSLPLAAGPWHAEQAGTLASGNPSSKIVFPMARFSFGAPPIGLESRSLKCAARAAIIDGLRACATLNMTGFIRLCSMKACNWFSMYLGCCPASRGMGKYPRYPCPDSPWQVLQYSNLA